MRITLIIFSLHAGGAERVAATMANFWAEKGCTVNLLTLDSGNEAPFYALEPAVQHRPLRLASISRGPLDALTSNVRRVRGLRRAIRDTAPDAVISFMSETNVLTLLATAGLRVPVLVQEQIDPHEHHIGRAWEALRRWTYPRATHLVALNQRGLSYFSSAVQKRGCIIPNPAIVSGAPRIPFSRNGGLKTLIAMGRLVPQKGFDLLLRAFADVTPKHPRWSLEILGEGPLRTELEAQIDTLALRGRVRLPGLTKEPHTKLRAADLFVMSSRYEGFPLSLCEAMACGLPAISFDCPTGPREIIRDGIDGVLVPPGDVNALGTALDRLMTDEQQRETLAAAAPHVLQRFGLPEIMSKWEALLEAAVARPLP